MAQYGSGYNSSYSGGRGPSNRGGYGGNRGYDNRQGCSPAPARPHVPLDGKKYVDSAETVIQALRGNRGGLLTTSKIRNLLSMISSLYDEVHIGDSKEKFLLFCKYMEALVAYHRFYGGKE